MTTPTFYNSLTKQDETLQTKESGTVRIYHCGPTVYKRQHLGNLRRFLFADFLRRTLEFLGYTVHEVTNITDVGHLTQDDIDAGEDKIAKEATAKKTTPQDIAQAQTEQFLTDIAALNIQPSHQYPRATDHIPHMHELIGKLLDRGHAYQTDTGVYFSVESFPAYGHLSGNTLAALSAGKRIEVRDEKKHPADFALWIFDDQALQRWDSPWGTGYPGWHIECSAMSMEYLGADIDIHTGGEDNKFPHHENEIAQSEGATGEPFARHWMHNSHLQLNGEKLAKREGEQLTLDTLTERNYSPLAFRLLIFGSHYRSKLDLSWEAMDGAQETLTKLTQLVRRLHEHDLTGGTPNASVLENFGNALAQDLNTPQALTILLEYVKQINSDGSTDDPASAADAWATLHQLDQVLGVFELVTSQLDDIPIDIQRLAQDREKARQAGEYEKADELRAKVEQAGYSIEDTDTGPRLIPLT